MRIRARGWLPLSSTTLAARVCVIGLSVVATGCAANKQPTYVGGPYAGSYGAAVPSRVNELRKVEVEDDGKPAQSPPVRKMRPEEDDPTQPWSPNYGSGKAAPTSEPVVPVQPRAPWPRPVEASVRTTASHPALQVTRRLSEAEAEDVMARAVAAHEMRKQ